MGYNCCIPKCTTGYKSNPKPKDVKLHDFPNVDTNKETRELWIKIVTKLRDDSWKVSKSSRVCSLHFRPEDFGKESVDKRSRTGGHSALDKQLKGKAYPSSFPGLPSYFKTYPAKERSGRTSLVERMKNHEENQVKHLETMWQRQEDERKVDSFADVRDKLKAGKIKVENELKSMGITTIWRENTILFCLMSNDDIPTIHYGLTIHKVLSLAAFVKDQPLSLKSLKQCNTSKLESVTMLVEFLKFIESKHEEILNPVDTVNALEFCAELLENSITNCTEETGIKINFIAEQIRLCTVENPKIRRYSQALLGHSGFRLK